MLQLYITQVEKARTLRVPSGSPDLFLNANPTGHESTLDQWCGSVLVARDMRLFETLWRDRGLLHGLAIADS
jgi:hypothetical protein